MPKGVSQPDVVVVLAKVEFFAALSHVSIVVVYLRTSLFNFVTVHQG